VGFRKRADWGLIYRQFRPAVADLLPPNVRLLCSLQLQSSAMGLGVIFMRMGRDTHAIHNNGKVSVSGGSDFKRVLLWFHFPILANHSDCTITH
jgi:hypothetical protein